MCLKHHLYWKLSTLISESYSNAASLIKGVCNATFCSIMRPRDGLDDGLHMRGCASACHVRKPQDCCDVMSRVPTSLLIDSVDGI